MFCAWFIHDLERENRYSRSNQIWNNENNSSMNISLFFRHILMMNKREKPCSRVCVRSIGKKMRWSSIQRNQQKCNRHLESLFAVLHGKKSRHMKRNRKRTLDRRRTRRSLSCHSHGNFECDWMWKCRTHKCLFVLGSRVWWERIIKPHPIFSSPSSSSL